MKILILIIILFFYSFNSQSLFDCTKYSDCFNCVSCGKEDSDQCKCEYSSQIGCYDSNIYHSLSGTIEQIFKNCSDKSSLDIQKKYCGNSEIKFVNNEAIIKLPKVNGYYAKENLFCNFKYNNIDNINVSLSLFNNLQDDILVYYKVNENVLGTLTNSQIILTNFKILNVYIYTANKFKNNPLIINIQKNGFYNIKINKLIIFYLTAITIVIIIFLNLKKNKKYKKIDNREIEKLNSINDDEDNNNNNNLWL